MGVARGVKEQVQHTRPKLVNTAKPSKHQPPVIYLPPSPMASCPGPKQGTRIPLRVSLLPCGSDYNQKRSK